MSTQQTIDPAEYKKAVQLVLQALTHTAQKVRTGKTPEEQIGFAAATEDLANAFYALYAPGAKFGEKGADK